MRTVGTTSKESWSLKAKVVDVLGFVGLAGFCSAVLLPAPIYMPGVPLYRSQEWITSLRPVLLIFKEVFVFSKS